MKRHAGESSNYAIKPTRGGKWHFILRASNGTLVGSIQLYGRRYDVRHGTAAAVKHAADEVRGLTV